jgi:hypothetical protein
MNSIETLLGLFLLVGSNHPQPSPMDNPSALPEVINTPDAVIIKATSRGCTKKRHFRIQQGDQEQLQAIRLKQDRCLQDPSVIEFHYTHKQLGLAKPDALTDQRIAGN